MSRDGASSGRTPNGGSLDCEPDYGASTDFLKLYSPDRSWVLIAIESDRKGIEGRTFATTHGNQCRQWLATKNKTAGIYFSVNPVRKAIAKKPDRTDIAELRWLHCDIDPEPGKPLEEEQARIRAMLSDPPEGIPKPTCVIFSGGGYGAFWRLREPRILVGTVEDAHDAARWNMALADALRGDPLCYNVDRIMRLPGTVNFPDAKKRAKGRVVAVARLDELSAEVFDLSQITPVTPEVAATRGSGHTRRTARAPDSPKDQTNGAAGTPEPNGGGESPVPKPPPCIRSIEDLPDSVSHYCKTVIVQGGDPAKFPSRSEALFFVVCDLIRAGIDDETIFAVITNPQFVISSSVIDKGARHGAYARRQIKNAHDKTDPSVRPETPHAGPLPPGNDWIDLSTEPDPGRLESLLRTPRFAARWRKDPEGMHDTSMSGFAMAIASIAALKGSGAPEIVMLVCAFYRHHGEKPPRHASFWRSTVSKALIGAEEASRNEVAFDDYHLADLFARDHGTDVRYCSDSDTWYMWDGKRWRADSVLEVQSRARMTLESYALVLQEVAAQVEEDNPDFAYKLRAHATKILSPKVASTCLDGARSTGIDDDDHRLCLPRDAFDDPKTTAHLLNCTNGVLDLTTGVLRSHEDCKQLFITKLCPVAYRPEAQCPLWLNTLDQIFEADVDPERARDLIEVLQFALGYSLSGEQSHHVVILLYGPEGRNGKSLIVRITLRILGRDYAMQAPPGLLRVKRGETHPTELADLHGRRFVATVETGRGEKLDEALVKQLSGGDRVKARRMREDFWEFEPTHHLWLATNALPRADSSDQALFTRFRVVPFRRRFLKPGDDGYENCAEVRRADDTLESRILASEQEGVLAWAVRGNQGYRKVGAVPNPQASQDATAEYRDENDPLVEWIEEQCETTGTDARDRLQLGSPWTETADLYASYVGWKNRRNEKPISSNLFGRALTAKGFPDARRGHAGTHGRLGIQLRCPAGQQPQMPGEEEVPF